MSWLGAKNNFMKERYSSVTNHESNSLRDLASLAQDMFGGAGMPNFNESFKELAASVEKLPPLHRTGKSESTSWYSTPSGHID